MTKRDRVTVNLLPSDAEWLRREADDHGVSLSVALQVLIGRARYDEEMAEEKHRRELRRAARLAAVSASLGRQLDFPFFAEGSLH